MLNMLMNDNSGQRHLTEPGPTMKKILIVDDHADIRRLIRMTLEFDDCEIREAGDAVAAWQLALQYKPDLVLLDVMIDRKSVV